MPSTAFPYAPRSLADAGLDQGFLAELVLKHLLYLGEFRMADVAERVKLPISLVELVLEEHRRERLIEVKGAPNYSSASYTFRLTDQGRRRAHEAMQLCRYAGPAPVTLEHYRRMVQLQTVQAITVSDDELKKALSHLVVNDSLRKRLGRALVSGLPVFIYGPSGNGKTSIAEAIGQALPESIYIPYAVTVAGQIITVFDCVNHTPVAETTDAKDFDARWIQVKRPVISTGGELTLRMLDLSYDDTSKCYDASLQMKANNGLFIVDDFGRQQVETRTILNRWMVPLERKIDHLSLHSGTNFVVPFDALVFFFADLEPQELDHDAFLRRLRYKIKIERPTEEEYLAIFKAACEGSGLDFDLEVYSYVLERWYRTNELARNACHPKALIELILSDSRYQLTSPNLTLESIKLACDDYFGES